jgi:di/tricarboxylate transporter
LPAVLLSLAGVGAMLLTGCLSLPHATRALDSAVLFLLAGMIPVGLAMQKTGLAVEIAEFVVGLAGNHGPIILIGSFYLLTSMLTELLSNNAAAVLLTPICLGVAASTGIDPKPLLIAVTFGASASFATPIGYQTNLMVMGPGGYLFRDYLRVGLPLNGIMCIVATALIPVFWPP